MAFRGLCYQMPPLRRPTAPQVCVLGVLALALALPATASAQPRAAKLGIATIGGLHTLSAHELGRELDASRAAGARWIRTDVNWASVQSGGRNSWNWAPFDRVIRGARARNLRVLATVGYTPAWARPAGTPAHHPPRRAKAYARFARAAARRYKRNGVRHWEIWNEPNLTAAWAGGVSALRYGRLLRAAARSIRRANRRAVIITGGLSPAANAGGNIAPVTFLSRLYRHGFRRSFDHVGHHPYTFPSYPSRRRTWSPWRQMAWTRPSLRAVMVRFGNRHKRIWATEYGAPTGSDRAVSESTQAAMLREAYRLWGRYSWTGPLFWFSLRDRGPVSWHTTCGLVRGDFSRKPAFAAYRAIADSAR